MASKRNRRAWFLPDPPHMKHGDADRIADFCERSGTTPLLPWQRDFLNRLESVSMDEQFREIVGDSKGDLT